MSEHSSELNLFRDMTRRLLEREVQPHYDQWEQDGIVPRQLWNTLGEAGLLAVDVPEEYGGSGVPFPYSMLILEEMGRMGFAALACNVMVHSDIVTPYLTHIGNEEQKQHWLPKLVSGEAVGAIAMTEPGAGSDLQGMRTTAKEDGDDFIINGSKTFITNGQHADLVIIAAKTDPQAGAKGVSLFLVDTTTPGFARGRNLDKIGMHSGDTSELFFEDMRVPRSAMLGELNRGFIYLMQELPRERLSIGQIAVACTRGALDWTLAYVQERKAFGNPISALQNTRFSLADMYSDFRASQALVNECIALYDRGELDAPTGSLAKLNATEMQGRVIDGCLQLFGGYGYMTEYPISRAYLDARVQRIYGGTSEIMKEMVARGLFSK